MTGPPKERPALNSALKEIHNIRLNHIQQKMRAMKDSPYKGVLMHLYNKRDPLTHLPHKLDDLDKFLLRMVDDNEKNKPSPKEAKQYLEHLNQTVQQKQTLNKTIESFAKEEKEKLLGIQQKFEFILKDLKKKDPSDNTTQQFINEFQENIKVLLKKISDRIDGSLKNDEIYKQANKILGIYGSLDQVINIKKTIHALKEVNDEYLSQHNNKRNQSTEYQNLLFSTNGERCYQNAIKLSNKLNEMLTTEFPKADKLLKIIQEHQDSNINTAELSGIKKPAKVEAMLKETQAQLQSLLEHTSKPNKPRLN